MAARNFRVKLIFLRDYLPREPVNQYSIQFHSSNDKNQIKCGNLNIANIGILKNKNNFKQKQK